jgi:hypothetical protein
MGFVQTKFLEFVVTGSIDRDCIEEIAGYYEREDMGGKVEVDEKFGFGKIEGLYG